MHSHKRMISIWFFIGILVLVYGVLILGEAVYEVYNPPLHPVVLFRLHAGVYWGVLLTALGLFYTLRFRPRTKV